MVDNLSEVGDMPDCSNVAESDHCRFCHCSCHRIWRRMCDDQSTVENSAFSGNMRIIDSSLFDLLGSTISQQVDKRSDAIRKCGTEIVKLRKHIEDIEQERHRLHSQLKALHRTTAEAEMVRKCGMF